jgi:hypothetical protein
MSFTSCSIKRNGSERNGTKERTNKKNAIESMHGKLMLFLLFFLSHSAYVRILRI